MEKIEVQAVPEAVQTPGLAIDIEAALAPQPAAIPTPQPVAAVQAEVVVEPVAEVADVAVPTMQPITKAPVVDRTAQINSEIEAYEDLEGSEIASIENEYWESFLKVIGIVSVNMKGEDILSINKGKLALSRNGGILTGDLTEIFGDHTWHIKDPSQFLKQLKLITGGDKITILNGDKNNIIYNTKKGKKLRRSTITKVDGDNVQLVQQVDPGVLKTRTEIDLKTVDSLVSGKNVLNALYYDITVDTDTFELLNIDLDNKYEATFASTLGRNTERYRATELFPVTKPENVVIFEVYEKAETDDHGDPVLDLQGQPKKDIFIKTISDLTLTTIHYQVRTVKNPRNKALDISSF